MRVGAPENQKIKKFWPYERTMKPGTTLTHIMCLIPLNRSLKLLCQNIELLKTETVKLI